MKYLYESHLGGLYISDIQLDRNALYCEQCGDYDWLIGQFETIKDFWSLIKDDCDINGSGGWSLQYLYPMIVEEFRLPDIIEHQNDLEKELGVCSHSDKYILERIEELIKENNNETT